MNDVENVDSDSVGWGPDEHPVIRMLPVGQVTQELLDRLQPKINADKAAAVLAGYKLGKALVLARADKYLQANSNLMENLAYGLAIPLEELEDLCQLASTYKPKFIQTCATRKSAHGNLIDLPYLKVVAKMSDERIRAELIEEFYRNDLPLRDLRLLIAEGTRYIPFRGWRLPYPAPIASLENVSNLIRLMEKLAKGLRTWRISLLKKTQQDFPNRQFTILLNRLLEVRESLGKNLKSMHKIEVELVETVDYLSANLHEPQDRDESKIWKPKPFP